MRSEASLYPLMTRNLDGNCAKYLKQVRTRVSDFLSTSLEKGVAMGEFRDLDIQQTSNVLFALVNGMLRQRTFGRADDQGIRKAAVDFCRACLTPKGN